MTITMETLAPFVQAERKQSLATGLALGWCQAWRRMGLTEISPGMLATAAGDIAEHLKTVPAPEGCAVDMARTYLQAKRMLEANMSGHDLNLKEEAA